MAANLTFLERLRAVSVPTSGQAIGALLLSLAFLGLAQAGVLISRLGLPQYGIDATRTQLHARFSLILGSPVASQIALVTFWAVIGLGAYLICWGVYNLLIQARNEVTLTTSYTNRGHWRGPYETLALKAVAGAGFVIVLGSLWYGVSFWLALSGQVFSHASILNAVLAILAVLGLALELYLVLLFAQLTLTPWYRAETFTEN